MKVTDLGVSAEPLEALDTPGLPDELGGALAALLTAVTGRATPVLHGASRSEQQAVVLTVRCLRANPGAAAVLGIGAPVAPERLPCPVCGRTDVSVTKSGGMRHHMGDIYEGRWRQVCKGVGQPPRTDGGAE